MQRGGEAGGGILSSSTREQGGRECRGTNRHMHVTHMAGWPPTCLRGPTLTCNDTCRSDSWRSTSWMRLNLRAMFLHQGGRQRFGQEA